MSQQMLPAGTLQDQVAIITGGGTGMGKAMALTFAGLGANCGCQSKTGKPGGDCQGNRGCRV
jgi:NAD(P)-dependent dehydrogenase (short-subunit alcohol dehydrogenase family)